MRFPSLFSRFELVALAVVAASGCRKDHFADGIGRPLPETVQVPSLVPVAIVEVFPAASGAFVELLATQDADLTGLDVVAPTLDAGGKPITISAAASGTLAAGQRTVVTMPAFGAGAEVNKFQSGEVAVVDGSGLVHSYFAWGADPASQGSALFVAALQSGVTTIASAIPVPFPRPDGTTIAREPGPLTDPPPPSCFDPSPGVPTTSPACPTPGPALALREVAPQNSLNVASFVELENVSGAILDVTGVRVCHENGCSSLPRSRLVAGAVVVACFGNVADSATSTAPRCPGLPLAAGDPAPAWTPLALPGSTAIPGDTETYVADPGSRLDAAALLDYMRTKLGAEALAAIAIADSLWSADPSTVPTGTYVPGESLSRNPGAVLPPVWNPARATPGTANPTIDRLTNWQTCAEPAAGGASPPDPLVVSVLSRVDGTITLTNTKPVLANDSGANDIALGDYAILIDDMELASGGPLTGTVRANSSVTFTAAIGDTGKLEVRRRTADVLEQFAQWGNPAAGVTAAVAVSLWPREDCVLPRLAIGESLVLRDRSLVRGSGGYGVQ